jgi:transmembrane sensor
VGVAAAGAGLLGMHLSGGVEVLTTGLGESRLVVLKDGSRITLGAASRLRVRINQDRRTLSLEKGEALFNVQADAARPFVVNSGGAEVIAVGTAFNVRHTLGRVNVAVTEGNVKVNSLPLAVGQQIWVMDGKLSLPSPVDITAILGRTAGRLEYNAEPLKYVAADLTRYSTVPVEVLDPAANEVLVTGTVMQTDLRGWLDGLQEALPVTVTFTSRAVTVRSR